MANVPSFINSADWPIYGLLTSFSMALFFLVNQHFHLKASTLMLWRGFGVAVIFLPLALLVPWPQDPVFYWLMVAQSIAVGVHDRFTIESSSRFGAGVTSRLLPIGVWLTFAIWLVLKPSYREDLFSNDLKAFGVIAALSVAVAAMLFIRKDYVSKQAIIYLAPAIFLLGIIDALNKAVIDASGHPIYGAIVYGFLLGVGIGIVTIITRLVIENRTIDIKEMFDKKAIKGGLIISGIVLVVTINKGIAMFYTPNPAYVGLIILAAPIWIAGYNKITGHKDKSNLWAGMLFVLSAVLLVLLTKV